MARQTKIINMSLPPEVYRELNRLARQKRLSRSEVLRRALRQYIVSENRWEWIRKWGAQTAKRLGIKTEEDVARIIQEFRREQVRH